MVKVNMNRLRLPVTAKSDSSGVSEGTLMESETILSQILSQRTEHFLLETIKSDMQGVSQENLDNTVTYFLEESQEMSQYLTTVRNSAVEATVLSGDSVVPNGSAGPEREVEKRANGVEKTRSGGDSEKADTSQVLEQVACNVEVRPGTEVGAGASKLAESESPVEDLGAVAEPKAGTSNKSVVLESPVEDLGAVADPKAGASSKSVVLEFPLGDFGVLVDIVDTKCSKNFAFSDTLDKIYCAPRYNIQFQFTLDQELQTSQEVKMVAFLRFVDREVIVIPVRRCKIHANRDMVALRKIPGISNEELALTQHVLRSDHPEALHLVDAESKRFKVSIALNPTEVKTGKFSRNFKFACLNSCFGRKQRALLEVVFEIYSSNTLIGKVTKNVRVCSLPIRDFHTDLSHLRKNETTSSESKRDVSSQSERKPKSRSRSGRKRKVRTKTESMPKMSSESGSKRKAAAQLEQKQKVEKKSKKPRVEQIQAGASHIDSHRSPSPSASSVRSEESEVSESEKALKQAKWILEHCKNENRLMRSLGNGCLKQIQHTYRLMKLAQHHQDCPKKA